ncbi:hypothetical protein BDZ91DRAFT_737436 [Kalaharituber pfeilii]|nr:hypothetical protein BDZ91DRAFT_737436 [Kalaharituber pfeilii]
MLHGLMEKEATPPPGPQGPKCTWKPSKFGKSIIYCLLSQVLSKNRTQTNITTGSARTTTLRPSLRK